MKPFQRMFEGLLLVLIDIHIGSVEVLPDFIGYILVAGGLFRLPQAWKEVKWARGMAFLLAAVSMPAMFLGQPTASTNLLMMDLDFLTLYHHALGVLKLFLMYFLFKVLLHWAGEKEKNELIKRTKKLFNIYFYTQFAYYAVLPFFFNIPDAYAFPMIIAVGVILIMELRFLLLLRAYNKEQQSLPAQLE